MSNDFNFDNGMQNFGREVLREVVKTDYGKACSFNSIDGHGKQDHHGGLHDKVVLFKAKVKGSGRSFQFFDGK